VGLLARALESEGIPTVCVVMNRDITENVKTPRALHVRFPYGAPLGPAADRETQRAVIHNALDVLVSATTPGAIVESHIEWPD
jgi:D-proline reductase (dithiol) PrdB